MKNLNLIVIIILLVTSLLVIGHSKTIGQTASAVDITSVKQQYQKLVHERSNGALKLESFEKTNSIPGSTEYHRTLKYNATVIAVREYYKKSETILSRSNCIDSFYGRDELPKDRYGPDGANTMHRVKQGAEFSFSGSVSIALSENGWLMPDTRLLNISNCKTADDYERSSNIGTAKPNDSSSSTSTGYIAVQSYSVRLGGGNETIDLNVLAQKPKTKGEQSCLGVIEQVFSKRFGKAFETKEATKGYSVKVTPPTIKKMTFRDKKTGAYSYKMRIIFGITIHDNNGILLGSQNYDIGNTIGDRARPTSEEAFRKNLTKVRAYVRDFLYATFPVQLEISELYDPNRKSINRRCKLSDGAASGVYDRQVFEVFAGDLKIGKIQVFNPPSTNTAECKIKDGAEKISEVFASGQKLKTKSILK